MAIDFWERHSEVDEQALLPHDLCRNDSGSRVDVGAGSNGTETAFQLCDAGGPDSTIITPTPPPPKRSPAIEVATGRIGTVSVPERLIKPHSIIAGWLSDHEARLREARLERDRNEHKWPA